MKDLASVWLPEGWTLTRVDGTPRLSDGTGWQESVNFSRAKTVEILNRMVRTDHGRSLVLDARRDALELYQFLGRMAFAGTPSVPDLGPRKGLAVFYVLACLHGLAWKDLSLPS